MTSTRGLRRSVLVGCRVWQTPDGVYRFVKPYQMDTSLRYRWMVQERDAAEEGGYAALDDDFATLAEARESVDV